MIFRAHDHAHSDVAHLVVRQSVEGLTHRHIGPHDEDDLAENTGRKTYKLTRSKKEAVWPPLLEKALLHALRLYRPASSSSRDPASLQRFPKRNKFISDYILAHTGKRRTAKQVGSRLQQLRETCTLKWVQALIYNKDFPDQNATFTPVSYPSPPSTPSSTPSSSESPSNLSESTLVNTPLSAIVTPTPPPSPPPARDLPLPTTIPVTIALWETEYVDVSPPSFVLDLDESMRRVDLSLSQLARESCPTVSFSSLSLPSTSEYLCVSSVYRGEELRYTDAHSPQMVYITSPCTQSRGMSLVPHLWNEIIGEYHMYTITHDIYFVNMNEAGLYEQLKPALFSIKYNIEGIYAAQQTHASVPDVYTYAAEPGQPEVYSHWDVIPQGRGDHQLATDHFYAPDAATFYYAEPLPYSLQPLPHPSTIYAASEASYEIVPSFGTQIAYDCVHLGY